MIWIIPIAVIIVGVIVREVILAPEVSDDYEVELWEKYRRKQRDNLPTRVEEPPRHSDAA